MFGWIEDGCPGVQILGLFCFYTLEMMIVPMVGLRVFKVSLSTLLSLHLMVGLGASSCFVVLAQWERFFFQLLVKRLALQVSLDGPFKL